MTGLEAIGIIVGVVVVGLVLVYVIRRIFFKSWD